MTDVERARAFFSADHFAMGMGIQIDEVEEGLARCSLSVSQRHMNADGHVMGGVIFTLADFAFAVAANLNRPATVTLSSQVTFLCPPVGGSLTAEAKRLRQGRRTCYYEVKVLDAVDTVVAVVGVTGFSRGESE